MKKNNKLSLKTYPIYAAKAFSFTKLILYTLFSTILAVLLPLTSAGYKGLTAVFTNFALFMVLAYTIMNVMAIVIKIRISKEKM